MKPKNTSAWKLEVAYFSEHGLTGEAVIQAADAALYQAKSERRKREERMCLSAPRVCACP